MCTELTQKTNRHKTLFNSTMIYPVIELQSRVSFYKQMPNLHISLLLVHLFLVWLAHPRQTSCLSIPFRKVQSQTHQAHNIEVEINQFLYAIDVTLENTDDFIFTLDQADQHLSRTANPDYRKYNDSIYGILRPTAIQRVDSQLPLLKRTLRNSFQYLKNIERKTVWTNQKYIKQFSWGQRNKYLCDGAFNLGASKKIIALDDVLKFSKFVRSPAVSWKMHDNNKEGQIILGDFPVHQLQDSSKYERIRIRTGIQYDWKMEIVAIKLKNVEKAQLMSNGSIQELTNISSKFKINLSEKKVKMPKSAIDSLVKHLEGCQVARSNTGGFPVVCQSDKLNYYSQFSLQLYTKTDGFSIDIPLKHLIETVYGNRFALNIQLGTKDDYQISPVVLREYLIGVNYRNSTMFIGRKASDPIVYRESLLNLFIGVNVLVFVASLLVVSIASKFLKGGQKESRPKQGGSGGLRRKGFQPKAGGYIMADQEEHSPSENQVICI